MKDLTNIAYSNDYIEYKNSIIELTYNQNNKINEKEIVDNSLKRIITEYSTENNDKKYYCSNNKVYDENKLIFEYFNLYHHPFFCGKIKYADEHEYLFYKTHLYGYNVFSIDMKKTFDYYPKYSSKGGETFIGTNIYFNKNNNIFAVEGCYWACPTDTFLIKIDNPLEQFSQYINIHLIIDEDYDKYDDVNFVGWENNDIKIKCYNIETKPYKDEIIILTEEEYTNKMINV
jgi:hypothetical protein